MAYVFEIRERKKLLTSLKVSDSMKGKLAAGSVSMEALIDVFKTAGRNGVVELVKVKKIAIQNATIDKIIASLTNLLANTLTEKTVYTFIDIVYNVAGLFLSLSSKFK